MQRAKAGQQAHGLRARTKGLDLNFCPGVGDVPWELRGQGRAGRWAGGCPGRASCVVKGWLDSHPE